MLDSWRILDFLLYNSHYTESTLHKRAYVKLEANPAVHTSFTQNPMYLPSM